MENFNDIKNAYKSIEDYNPRKERKVLIVFDMITDMISNKKLNPVVTKLFVKGRKLSIYLVFVKQSNISVPKYTTARLNTKHFFYQEDSIRKEIQQIVINHSSYIDFKEFRVLYKKCTAKNIHLWLLILLFHQIIDNALKMIY